MSMNDCKKLGIMWNTQHEHSKSQRILGRKEGQTGSQNEKVGKSSPCIDILWLQGLEKTAPI